MTSRRVAERQSGTHRESDDHSGHDTDEVEGVSAGRPWRPSDHENDGCENTGNHRSSKGDEHPPELTHGNSRRRKGHAEAQHPDESEKKPARFSRRFDSVTLG